MDLGLDRDALATCVQCGLCLPHCPTFRVTGDESRSPRGRIALMRAVQHDNAPLTSEVRQAFDTCVQCRGCESACPSQVHFGELIERTNSKIAADRRIERSVKRLLLAPLSWPRALRALTTALWIAQRLGVVPSALGIPPLKRRRAPLVTSGRDVWLFTGCVMDAFEREVHQAGQRVLEAAGFGVRPTGDLAPCCGALHGHAGLTGVARRRALQVIERIDGDAPILVDSAGCGASMKEYGRLLGTDEAHRFAARVVDISEWLARHRDLLPEVPVLPLRVAIQDPCHLRHVQRVHQSVRDLLRPFVDELIELDDDGLCCGAGGLYSVVQPSLSRSIRQRKVAAIGRALPDLVASANPGCAWYLSAAGVRAVHPMTIIDAAIAGDRSRLDV